MFYMYDSNTDNVKQGFPKKISEYFGGQNSSSDTIPDNLDSVFFNLRTKHLQFFKDDYVSKTWQSLSKFGSSLVIPSGNVEAKK